MLPISSVVLAFDIPNVRLGLDEGYARLSALVERLGSLNPRFKNWNLLPDTRKEKLIPFSQKEAVMERVGRKSAEDERKYVNLPEIGGFSAELTNVDTEKAWREAGCVSLTYTPNMGAIRFTMLRPVDVLDEKARHVLEGVLVSICELEDVSFANCNVVTRKTPERERLSYQQDFAAFPHRKYFGWMGFVPRALRKADIPEAASVAVVAKKGSVLVAVDGVMDLGNPDDIKAANLLEMKLVDLDLLPVTDPNFQ